jgi:hypothetical protein
MRPCRALGLSRRDSAAAPTSPPVLYRLRVHFCDGIHSEKTNHDQHHTRALPALLTVTRPVRMSQAASPNTWSSEIEH